MPDYLIKKPQLYTNHFYNPIHKFNFYVAWSESRHRLGELLNHLDDCDEGSHFVSAKADGSMHHIRRDGQDVPVICLPFKWDRTPEQIAIIAHEVTHAICFFFRCREIPLPKNMHHTDSDEENFCYFMTWLMENIIQSLDNQDKNKSNFSFEKESKLKVVIKNDKRTSRKTRNS